MKDNFVGSEIAIIGMAGRFPMARNIKEFWENLSEGRECIQFLTEEDKQKLPASITGNPNYVPSRGGVLEDKDLFDSDFFHYTPLEAELLDPQIRLFHECAWEALEDACIIPKNYSGLIGVYAAASSGLYWQAKAMMSSEKDKLGYFGASSLFDKDLLSTRVSYKLNLKGPSMMIHTTCSGSLVAVHTACQAILSGECDVALAGGVKVNVNENRGYIHENGMILSQDGHCRAFDERASGTVGGEGLGIVVLKALEDAIRDKDQIHGIIRGTAINNDGDMKLGYTAPSIEGQAQVIRTALGNASVPPEFVSYIEAHGTGTEIGDPIELDALKQAFRSSRKEYCAVGSVKTNIGHLDSASGVAGLIKTVMALKHKQIPASLNYTSPNRKMDIGDSPFFINDKLREWNPIEDKRIAGISSFGIGGTNAHVILEEVPKKWLNRNRDDNQQATLLLSANSAESLDRLVNRYQKFLKDESFSLQDACFTSQTGRHHFPVRYAVTAKTRQEMATKLQNLLKGHFTKIDNNTDKQLVFMFSGQGSQYINMAAGLYDQFAVFKYYIDKGLQNLDKLGMSQISAIWKNKDETDSHYINDTFVAQPLLYILEYALAQLLLKLGIKPQVMIGHSLGEYVAATVSGVFSFEDGVKIVTLRGQFMQEVERGSMISVPLSEKACEKFIGSSISLAASNTPASCVLSGSNEAIQKCISLLNEEGIEWTKLHTSHAFHSLMMEDMMDKFEKELRTFSFRKPEIPFISNISGKHITDEEATSPLYWTNHIRSTVRFFSGIENILKAKDAVFIEIGPGRTLSNFVKQSITDRNILIFSTIRSVKEVVEDSLFLANSIGNMWSNGIHIDWVSLHEGMNRRKISIPTYAFIGKRYWLNDSLLQEATNIKSDKAEKEKMEKWFYTPVWKQMAPLFRVSNSSDKTIHIVFADKEGFADSLKTRFEAKASSVVWVSPGHEFSNLGNGNFTVSVAEYADYIKLFKSIEFSESAISIIDCWSLSFNEGDRAIFSGVYHQIALAQAVLASGYNKTLSTCIISNQVYAVLGVEEINAAKRGVTGLMKVLCQELPSFLYHHLDIDITKSNKFKEDVLENICYDIFNPSKSGSAIAYRHGIRWQMEYDQFQLPDLSTGSFKHKGCYLITGGLGMLGLYLAEYLINEYQAAVIVTHHSYFPDKDEWASVLISGSSDVKLKERIKSLKRIEQYNGRLSIKSNVDFASPTSVRNLFNELSDTHIDGVFHFAAVTDTAYIFKPIDSVEREDCVRVIAPKFEGLRYLANELKDKKLDFCFISSSLSSILGGLGFSAYATANALLDAVVNNLNLDSVFPWMCVNFDSWKIGNDASSDAHSISNKEGIKVIEKIVGSGGKNQVIVSVRDLYKRILDWTQPSTKTLESNSTSSETVLHLRPDLSTPYIQPKTKVESILENILKNAFGYDKIGVDDDFFELGGDSLLAINLISSIHKQFNVRILIKDFYNSPTIKGLTNIIATKAIHEKHKPIKPTEQKEYYGLSQIQMRIYIEMQLNASETHYNTPFVFTLEGKISSSEVELIFNKLIERHEALRTSFRLIKGIPKQVVEPSLIFRLNSIAWDQQQLTDEPEGTLRQIVENFVQPFDLTKAPLVRAAFVTLHEDKHVLLMDIHHIITDAISNKVLMREMQTLLNNRSPIIQKVQYKDFCEWHNAYLANNSLKNQEKYWLQRLSVNMPYTLLPSDFERTTKQQLKAKHAQLVFDSSQFQLIQNFILSKGLTTYIFVLSVIYILLSKYTNQTDIIVGTETGGRNHADLDSVVGMFVGLLPLRNEVSANKTFEELSYEVRENLLQDYQNQDYQFSDMVKRLKLSGTHGRNPLFNIIVSMDNISTGGTTKSEVSNERSIRLIDFQGEKTIWDIRFGIFESEEKLSINIIYAADLFAAGSIDLITKRISDIVQQVLLNPSVLIKDVKIKSSIRNQVRNEQLDKALDFEF